MKKKFPNELLNEAFHTSEINEENNVLRENDNTGNGTGYEIRWGNGTENSINDVTQSTDWNGNFGWYMKLNDRITQFKTSLQLNIKETDDYFREFDRNLMSHYYEKEESDYHFVFYAMQWCQPVWDGIEDAASGEVGAITENSYIQHADYHGMNMHIVTTYFDLSGSSDNGGKGYGKSEYLPQGGTLWRGGTGHRGIDLHTRLDANLFALHSGKVKFKDTGGNVGKKASLSWKGNHSGYLDYCHLNSGENIKHVLSGQIIGKAGRSGNLGAISKWPGHVHINIQASGYEIGLRNNLVQKGVDNWNIKCIPNNDYPLLLPCSCHITSSTNNPENCNFSDNSIVHGSGTKPCWLVQELSCPHMSQASFQDRAIQAQLRYLHKNDDQNYSDPGKINGELGLLPQSESEIISSSRSAIKKYKQTQGLNNDTLNDYNADEDFIQNINEVATITQL